MSGGAVPFAQLWSDRHADAGSSPGLQRSDYYPTPIDPVIFIFDMPRGAGVMLHNPPCALGGNLVSLMARLTSAAEASL